MQKTTCILPSLLLFLTCGVAPLAQGDPVPPEPETPSAPPKALSFPFSYTGEGLANLSGGYKQGAIYEGLLSIGVQGDMDQLMGWKGGSFLVSGIYPHGASLTANYTHDFNVLSNIDAYDSPRLYEAWAQQELADGKLSIRLGQILADAEFFISENGALFLNSAFGAIPLISMNFDAPVYPVPTPGLRVRWKTSDSITVQAGIFDGNAGDQATNNQHGVDWRLNEGVFALAEVAYTVNGEKESKGLRGVYKLGAFFHSATTDNDFPNEPSESNGGGYFIIDQQLWQKPDAKDQGLSGFLRIGGAPEDRSTVPFYFDTGFNYKGLIPGREKDIAGIGLSYTKLSGNLAEESAAPVLSHHETILEATYKIQLKDWLTAQPDIQYIFNPGATENADNALVAGVRFNVSF